MSLEDAFLADILEHPDDDTPRLVYADWLDDHGQAERAEFIRAQCRLERMAEDNPRRPGLEDRVAELERVWGPQWARPFCREAKMWSFRRGFVAEIWLSATRFLAAAGRLFRRSPVRTIHLSNCGRDLGQLLISPFLRRLSSLDLSFNHQGDTSARELAACPALQNLTTLDLSHNDIGDEGVEELATGPHLPNLESLDVSFND